MSFTLMTIVNNARVVRDCHIPSVRFKYSISTGSGAPNSGPAMTSASSWVGPLYPVTGVVSCICVARGRDFYQGEKDVETKIMQEAFGPKAQLVGFFGNGVAQD